MHVHAQIRLDSAAAAAAAAAATAAAATAAADQWSEAEEQGMFFSLEFIIQESHLIRFWMEQ